MLLQIVPLLLSVIIGMALYAGLIKLTARLYRRTGLPWRVAFGFGAIAMTLAIIAAVANQALHGILPLPATLLVGLAVLVAVGAWFLSTRATNATGNPIGFKSAAVLSALAIALAFMIGIALAIVIPALVPR